MSISRRQFLHSSLLVAPTFAFMPIVLKRAVAASTSESFGAQANMPGTLVVVQMKGGNDGLNTLVPYTDNRYYDLRGTLALPQSSVLPLDSEVGLHPPWPR